MRPNTKLSCEYIPSRFWFHLDGRSPRAEFNNGIWKPQEFLEYQSKRSLDRSAKYRNHGFTIHFIDNFEEELLESYKNIISSLEFFNELGINLDDLVPFPLQEYE